MTRPSIRRRLGLPLAVHAAAVALWLAWPPAASAEVKPGDPAPDFTLRDVNDMEYTLSDLRGKVVLLDLIGYDCPPCIKAAPEVDQIWRDFRGTGAFQALALDMWNGTVFQVQGYIDVTGTSFPVLRNAGPLREERYFGIPFDNYLVIDPEGIVRYTSVNEAGSSFNNTAIRSAIQAYLPVPVETHSWGAIKGLYR